jgi:hypothetical protein
MFLLLLFSLLKQKSFYWQTYCTDMTAERVGSWFLEKQSLVDVTIHGKMVMLFHSNPF